jgi:CRP/FNR family cyclic AMP-dependent transcriptional regulator
MGGHPGVPETDDALRAALSKSQVRDLPAPLMTMFLADATRLRIPTGGLLRSAGEAGPHLELVVTGLLRIFVLAPDGRTLTVRYCRSGDLVGLVSLFRDPYVMQGSIQAVTESDLLSLRPAVVRRLADAEIAVARVLLAELSERVVSFVAEIPGNVFASVRQRVVRHLLDLATDHQQGVDLVAHVTQQELADAVGTAREVVVRVLRDLRAEGLVTTGRDRITIRAPTTLYAERVGPGKGLARESAGRPAG